MKLILALAISSILFSSCEKCVTCNYAAPGLKPYSSDYCSKRSKDIDAFKKSVSDEAQRYGTSAECIDK
jgi:hypothetical protein